MQFEEERSTTKSSLKNASAFFDIQGVRFHFGLSAQAFFFVVGVCSLQTDLYVRY